jgi:hypothetical protein
MTQHFQILAFKLRILDTAIRNREKEIIRQKDKQLKYARSIHTEHHASGLEIFTAAYQCWGAYLSALEGGNSRVRLHKEPSKQMLKLLSQISPFQRKNLSYAEMDFATLPTPSIALSFLKIYKNLSRKPNRSQHPRDTTFLPKRKEMLDNDLKLQSRTRVRYLEFALSKDVNVLSKIALRSTRGSYSNNQC